MALIPCSECGNLVSENATSCPKCGQPIHRAATPQPNRFADQTSKPAAPVSSKDKTTAGILALLIGGLGIHYFYLGKSVAGIVFLLLCCTGIPSILAFIQGILMLTMTDEQFEAKYVDNPSSFPLF
ncbi:MAG: TM2 domain-containing protein [Prevotella sp.]|jgi:TM2 domain-containing membrane protein YozV|nr:TM2 domain-containing protein [Prevotella sp.]